MSDAAVHDRARLDIGRLWAPTDDPATKGFMDALEPINAPVDGWVCGAG